MKDHSNPIHLAISHINEMMKAENIFCYSCRSHHSQARAVFATPPKTVSLSMHYYFLVITADETIFHPGDCITIDNPDGTTISCTLVVHTMAEVMEAIKENNGFFHTVLKNAEMVYSRTGMLPAGFSVAFDSLADKRQTQEYGKALYENLKAYTETVIASQRPHICVPRLSEQLEQACLLVIYVMMGYEPENHNLSGLFNLCNIIDKRFECIIPRITEQDRYHYELLMQGFWKGKYGRDREPIVDYLSKACDDFTALAEEICKARLKAIAEAA